MSGLEKNPEKYKLTEDQNEYIFQKKIKPKVFHTSISCPKPVAIIFGGQPGSGKSISVDLSVEELKFKGGCALIVGDEFRDYHPQYEALLSQDDKTAAFYTDRDIGLWVEKSIAYAKKLKCNLVIEGTMRVPEKVAETMRSLREAGYEIEVRALAVNERLSWQGILQRYENQHKDQGYGRMTTPESHQAGYKGMLESLDRIEKEKLADKIIIYKRGAEVIYENELQNGKWKKEPLARASVENERNRPWTLRERANYAKNFDALIELITKPERNATPAEIEAMTTLQKEAYAQISSPEKTADISVMQGLSKETQELLINYLQQAAVFKESMAQKIMHMSENPALQKEFAQLSREARQNMLQLANELAKKEDFKSLHAQLAQEHQEDILEAKQIPPDEAVAKFNNQTLSAQETMAIFKQIHNNVAELQQAKTQSHALDEGLSY